MSKERTHSPGDTITQAQLRLDQIEKTGATFLITDLDVAITLSRIAADAAENSQKRKRNRANARRAYDTVSRLSRQALLTDDEQQNVKEKLAVLKSMLEQLGEVFS